MAVHAMIYDYDGNEVGFYDEIFGDIPFDGELVKEYLKALDSNNDVDSFEPAGPPAPSDYGTSEYVVRTADRNQVTNINDVLNRTVVLIGNLVTPNKVNNYISGTLLDTFWSIYNGVFGTDDDYNKALQTTELINQLVARGAISYGTGRLAFQSGLANDTQKYYEPSIGLVLPMIDRYGNIPLDYNGAISLNTYLNSFYNTLQRNSGLPYSSGGGSYGGGLVWGGQYWDADRDLSKAGVGGWMKSRFGNYVIKKHGGVR